MRLLHVNKFLYRRGGAEAYMEDVAGLQAEAGHDVGFWGMSHHANTHVELAATFPPELVLEPLPPGVSAKLRAAAHILWSRAASRGMEAALDAFRPDVVHLHNVYHHLTPSILGPLRRRRVPTVMTLHDYKLACPTYQLLDKGTPCQACVGGSLTNAVRRRCKGGSLAASGLAAFELSVHRRFRAYEPIGAFICPSRFLHDVMRRADVHPDRLHHVPHFVDAGAVAVAARPGRGVITAGRLAPEKGVDTLIRAVGLADGIELTVAGEGPQRAALEQLAAAVAPGRVHFLGRLAKEQLHERIRAAAVVAVPSAWFENQPMIVLEAFTCGRPVVGTALGGIPELVTDGEDGCLVPASDPVALAAALRSLLADPDAAHRMGLAARHKAVSTFDSTTHLRRLEDVYAVAAAARAEEPAA